ncbi:AbrB/MazE/SpoVT family DNA-binding domain-containing protein [Enterobacter kobei]|jgi:antitoxin ChpS|uniref:Antitoxin ChpS n=2 Tax=Enterobacter kobei TaxID=208224 RepID=A0ACC8S7G4_9ENTR|nr:AbrB/MazE/SpoVT family DNA-binding domain-containing protein [Enterobacter kobei]MDF3008061.1 chpS [Enterobacter kobei]OLR19450.1 antitoxin ChpS [Enterobacter kobei]WNP34316.1 AbrB/MazE/SpoVT family DNA-binding domain-containing protein [Enterobacter kobei]SIR18045.1 antitoxin ChpS [Enterobacter kobei]BCU57345.1 antitoxin [Enterobacter kobei]
MSIAIKKWGNSNGVVLPALLLKQLGVGVGQSLDAEVRDGALILTPVRQRYTLEELVAQCDASAPATSEEEVWGKDAPVGNEIW